VVLQPGLGEPSAQVSGWIAPAVAQDTRVCVYDRAGRGWSEAASGPQDGVAAAADLHTLLERAQIPGPYVLVGHSSGGVYVRIFAEQYPDDVAGMVLLDSQPNEAFTRLPTYPTAYAGLRRLTALFPSLARTGAMRLSYQFQSAGLPPQARAEERAFWSTARHNRSLRDEVAELPTALQQAQALTSLGDKPLIVLTAVKGAQTGWLPLQDEMAALSSNSLHRVLPDATHVSLVEDQGVAAVSSQAIREVVAAIRDARPLSGS
jgi:pimeloyl-ACP methyl ester carboxylesterase